MWRMVDHPASLTEPRGGTTLMEPYLAERDKKKTWRNPGGTLVEPPLRTTPQPLQKLVEPYRWNFGGTLVVEHYLKYFKAAPEHPGAYLG